MTNKKTFIAIFAILSLNSFAFSESSPNLPNFAALAEQTSPAVVNVSVTKTINQTRSKGIGSRSPFPLAVLLKTFLIFHSSKGINPKEKEK